MTQTSYTGRAAFMELLIQEGVTHMFGNPGTTELALMEVVPQYPQMKYVLGLQESIVLGMADGYGRASGKLSAVNLHCTPGLGHAMGALYTAKFSGSPIIVTAGQYESGYGLTEPLLAGPLVRIAEPLVKWAVEVERAEDLPRIVHRAAKIALTPPTGPVFISLPGSILDESAMMDLGHPSRVQGSVQPDPETLKALVARIRQSRRPVILAGHELGRHNCFDAAGELAIQLGAPVFQESVPYNSRFPTDHPASMGEITRNQHKILETLSQYDLLICLGADLLRMSPKAAVEPLPPGMPVIHLSERDAELGKNYPTEMAIQANVASTLRALLPVLEQTLTAEECTQARQRLEAIKPSNWSAKRESLVQSLTQHAQTSPAQADYAVLQVVQALTPDTIVVDENPTYSAALFKLMHANSPSSYFGLTSGGLGFAMAGAIGASLAHPGRPVVATVGDGSSLYSIQAMWTAANLKLPVTYVVFNNRSYQIIKDRLVAMRHSSQFVGMDMNDPVIDFVAVAKGFGLSAIRVEKASDIQAALRQAIASGKPSLIDIAIAPSIA